MPPAARVNDLSQNPADTHGCPTCAHPVVGPIVQGSPDVFTNGQNAARKADPGIHAACCGPNSYKINAGSATVFINDKPAARLGDETKHCGGTGKIVMGSSNVIIGDAGGGGGGGGASTGGGVGKSKLKPADLAPSSQVEHRGNPDIAKAPDVTSAPEPQVRPTWIEIVLMRTLPDGSEKPEPGKKYQLLMGGDVIKEGVLDSEGKARVEDVPDGPYQVKFPELEQWEW